MSILYKVEITKQDIMFIGRTRELEFFLHKVELKGNCDDEKWFDLVCEFWDNDCELNWDEVEKVIQKAGE